MRFSALVLPALMVSAAVSVAQTGFSTKSYPAVLPSTSDNMRLLTADLNGDGRPDLVSYGSRFNGSAPVNVFLNNGGGGFLAPFALTGSSALLSVQTGDMNGDGYPDIVGCANVGSGQTQAVSVTVYLNNGTAGFTAQPSVTGNGQCNALTLGDVFQNGHLDVISAGYTPGQYDPGGTFYPGNTTYVNVFANNGSGILSYKGTFSPNLDDPSNSTFSNCGAIDVVGGDFLQIGKFDLMVTTKCQPKGQNLPGNVGTSFLVTETTDQYGNEFYTKATHIDSAYENYVNGKVFDVNGDGKPDILFDGDLGGNFGGGLIYFQNNGSGSFTVTSLFNGVIGSSFTGGATVADFNGDGFNDIATTYNNGNSPPVPTLSILAGTKGGAFTVSQSFSTGSSVQSSGDVASADFNGDGKADLATLVYDTNSRTTSLNIYTNTQSGSSNPCAAPSTANKNQICSPTAGATLNSPVTVNAASNVTGFTANRLYLDNQDVYDTYSQVISTPISAATGNHTLVLVSYNNKGQAFTSSVSFSIGNSTGGGCIPSTAGVSICSPVNGSVDNPPVTITAGATAQSGYITAMRVYVDNIAEFTQYNSTASTTFQFTQGGFDFGQGAHHLVIVAYESTGGALSSSLNFSEPTGPCTPPPGGTGLRICTPLSSGTNNSPVTVSAGANSATGYVAAIRAYVDNQPVALYTNPQQSSTYVINQPLAIAPGRHYFVLVAYPSTGGSVSAGEYIQVQ